MLRKNSISHRMEFATLRWGFPWPKSAGGSSKLIINARLETAAEKPMFRAAFKTKRCLIPAKAWFEQKQDAGFKQRFEFNLADAVFAFAGLWEIFESPNESSDTFETCVILTKSANEKVMPIHDRMPCIVPPQLYEEWLGISTYDSPSRSTREGLEKVLQAYNPESIEVASQAHTPKLPF